MRDICNAKTLKTIDPALLNMEMENAGQERIELIASENFVSRAVLRPKVAYQ